jgi:branched-chain amino acid transport system substrate-binding protein
MALRAPGARLLFRPGRARLAVTGVAMVLGLAAPARADIAIAVAAPMSGPFSELGVGVAAGAKAAVDALNAAGGVLGQTVTVATYDDRCDEDDAVTVANGIVAAGAALVVGHVCSLAAIAAAAVYAAHDIPLIATGAGNPDVTDERPGPGIFRLYGRDDDQAPTAAGYIAQHFADAPVAVFDDDTSYGAGLADAVRVTLTADGVTPALVDTFSRTDPRTAELVDRLAFRQIGLLFVGAYPDEIAALTMAIAARGLAVTVMAGDAAADPAFADAAGTSAAGTLFTAPPDPAANPTAAVAIAALAAAGTPPDGMTLYAYAAVQVWAQAIAAAGSTDFTAVAHAIASGMFDTVIGTVGFGPRGDMTLPGWMVWRWTATGVEPAP